MGCKSNQFEGSIIIQNLENNSFEQVKKPEEADIFILNSCSVTSKSDSEAFYILRNIKHKKPEIITVLTGCIAQVEKEKLLENDFIDYVIGNDEKLNFFETFQKLSASTSACIAADIMNLGVFHEIALDDTTKTRASLKIQDGCDSRCTYCIIPFARGKSRSADKKFVAEQINNFSKHGFKEVVFTGIHIGQWGKDTGESLIDLLKYIEDNTAIERYRLGSLNPTEINDSLLELLSQSEKFCPHFHLSLQSACNKTLRSMNRFYKVEDYLEQIEHINEIFDMPFLGSDIITGFAGESDEDFEVTRQNLELSGLSQIHTFPYSKRKGTIGASLPNQVDEKIKEQRASIVKEISARKLTEFINKNTGTEREVLIEKHPDKKTGFLKGVTKNYLTLLINSQNENLLNTLAKVRIKKYQDGKIYSELI